MITIRIPKCWRDLVDLEDFSDEIDSMRAGDRANPAPDDPTPYYDDGREVSTTVPDGNILTLSLYSGQSNYWVSCKVTDPAGEIVYESEPWDNLDDSKIEIETDDDEIYVVDIEFVD